MPLFNQRELALKGVQIAQSSGYKTSNDTLEKYVKEFSHTKSYDIFLSHSFRDARIILGLKQVIESIGYTIYVDWVDDTQLDRCKVTSATARLLRERMKNCKCLLYAFSVNSQISIWMPWELGYFDGCKGKVAILPITDEQTTSETYRGQEYLGLYYYVTKGLIKDSQKLTLWINQDEKTYVTISDWLNGSLPSPH